jgi:hypothetical protein
MPLIGEELRTILGMMPVRDRAGIARGTMADDAMKASAAADGGNAEGAALMQQGGPAPMPGQRPPMPGPPQVKLPPMGGPGRPPPGDIQLPANVPTAFASGSGGGGPAVPPAPQERVVAASPAAAPSRTVGAKASEVAIAALEQQNRQQKMMQLVGSLGLIANAFNRNPQSAAATRSSLADMVGGGGGGRGGGGGLADIKTIADMQRQEAADSTAARVRTETIGKMVKGGMSPEDAAVEYDNNLHTQRLGATAEGILEDRKRADLSREEMLRPAVVTELSRRFNQPEEVIRAGIRSGKIDPKAVSDILETQSTTASRDQKTKIEGADFGVRSEAMTRPEAIAARLSARLGREVTPDEVKLNAATDATWQNWIKEVTQGGQAEVASKQATTASTQAGTREKIADLAGIEEAQKTPAAVAERYRQMGYGWVTEDTVKSAAANKATWTKFNENHQPLSTEFLKNYEAEQAARVAKGEARQTHGEYAQSKEKSKYAGPGEAAQAGIIGGIGKKYTDAWEEVETSNVNREGTTQNLFKAWDSSIRAGGNLSEKENALKKTFAKAFGREDMAGAKTDVFFALLDSQAAAVAQQLPGSLSDKDVLFIKSQVGSKNMSPEAIRQLMIINDNIQMAKDEQKREMIIRAKAGSEDMDPETAKALKMIPTPAKPQVNYFVKQLANDPAKVARIAAARDDPEEMAAIDHTYGRNATAYVLEKYDREQAAKGGR